MKAIRNLTFSQRGAIKGQFVALSNLLKTGASFGYQPVVFDDKLLEMFDFFLKNVRPLLRAVLSKAALENPVSFLWPDWNANMMPAPSDMVQRYCSKMGLQINSTTIRCLWEMKVEWMYQQGCVSTLIAL